MVDLELLRGLAVPAETKMVMLIIDGLGGLPLEEGGGTELEAARTPNLDVLAARSICGLVQHVGTGITPGSGPGHLSLFGYDPLKYQIGRGVLEALGIDLELTAQDVAARGNFCTVDEEGRIVDRRAGRIPTEVGERLCERLARIQLPGAELIVRPVAEHRFVVVFRGEGLSDQLIETDPQRLGIPPLPTSPTKPEAERTAKLVNEFVEKARALLAKERPANMVLLRGFAKVPALPTFQELFHLRPLAIAAYPMYRGLAKLVGMKALRVGRSLDDLFKALAEHYADYDFFYLHVKKADSAGEDGDFAGKVLALEEVDRHIPSLLQLRPDVIVVTGDHSTPSALKGHSWHPVPILLFSRFCRPDSVREFSERGCLLGGLGRIRATEIMPLVLANALRLQKFGA